MANSGSSTLSLLFGDGRGQFGSRRDLITPKQPADVLAGDFNNDGHQDVVAIGAGHFTTNGWVFLGDGTGGFGSPITFSTTPIMHSVACADLNRDGNLDLVIGREVTFATVLFGNGAGEFPTSTSLPAGSYPLDVATGDFNKDGKIDVATANLVSQNIILFFGDGAGGVASTQIIGGTFPQLLHVTVADLNRDGNSDLLATTTTKFHIFLGAGNGTFSAPITRDFPGDAEKQIAVGEFNNDGFPDVTILDGGFSKFYVFLGIGDGNVNLGATVSITGPGGVMAGDFNEDGISDIGMVRLDSAGPRTLPAKLAIFLTTDLIVPSTSIISSPVSVTLNAVDHISGVASTSYRINDGPVQTYTTTFPLTNDGVYNIEYWSVDVAGNTETHKTFIMRIDSTAPHTQAFLSGSAGTNGWYGSDVEVSLSATDNVSGVQSTFYRIDDGAIQDYSGPFVISALGQHTVEYWSVDNLKNTEVAQSVAVNVDTIAPSITAAANPSTASKKPQPITVTISGTVTDNISGVSDTSFSVIDEYGATQPSGPFTLQANGNYSFTLTLPATKNGPDKDGHLYTIRVTASDRAAISATATATVRIN